MITNDGINIKKYLERKFNSNNIPEVEALAQIIGLDAENNIARMQPEAEPDFTPENVANKKQTVTNSETDYPSGKAVYDALGGIDSGASSFTDLTDAPSSYAGQSGKLVSVKSTEDGVEFVDAPEGGGGDSFTLVELTDPGACSATNGTYFEIETDTDGVLSLVNDAIGVQYGVIIENTNTTDVITIALPVNDKKPSNVITIAPLRCRELSLLRLSSTKRIIEFGELIS